MFPKHPHYETAREKQAADIAAEVAAFLARKKALAARMAGHRVIEVRA